MKHTILYDKHIGFNAKMVPFAEFSMPLQYTGITDEHNGVRTSVGVFDVSHMGEFTISGNDAENFLQLLTTNDIKKLAIGQAQYSTMCLENGGIIDDLVIYRFDDHYMMVVNAANIGSDFQWISNKIKGDVTLRDISDETNLIAVQGPKSGGLLHGITDHNLSKLKFYHFIETNVAGYPVVLSRTGYTGELGFEIYGNDESILAIWDKLFDTQELQVLPVGLGARDTLRMEMKYTLYGMDIDRGTTPIEAGLRWITKFDKGAFIGRESLMDENIEYKKRLVCFEMMERAVPRHNYDIFVNEKQIGMVTSGTQSPSLNKGIGLGYVEIEYANPGTKIDIDIRGRKKSAIIMKPPLYKQGTVNL
ncbi:MAG TPA: glycine cleavage system aminomethyltransferase GcvT [Candidatus Marinimicrobia bacterium]|jgi:aminomethyltransferase|nr:glycine cleavage system aminomethyltransferase GcvT [Candidatus Neomarinimicrobiota bacterium]|tara:strand:- start:655 stop:1740 length:1086 start_codon:yes stop_codon:yes gene_type:complete